MEMVELRWRSRFRAQNIAAVVGVHERTPNGRGVGFLAGEHPENFGLMSAGFDERFLLSSSQRAEITWPLIWSGASVIRPLLQYRHCLPCLDLLHTPTHTRCIYSPVVLTLAARRARKERKKWEPSSLHLFAAKWIGERDCVYCHG